MDMRESLHTIAPPEGAAGVMMVLKSTRASILMVSVEICIEK